MDCTAVKQGGSSEATPGPSRRISEEKKKLKKSGLKPANPDDNGTICSDTLAARALMKSKDYDNALLMYNKAISCYPPNMDDLCKERTACLTKVRQKQKTKVKASKATAPPKFSKYSLQLFRYIFRSYAKDQLMVRKDQRAKKSKNKGSKGNGNDLHAEQELLIKAYLEYNAGNFSEALESFQKATSGLTSGTEARFCVAVMLHYGQGVKRDINQSIKMLQETALLPPGNARNLFNNCKNVGVAESRYFLGTYFQQMARKEETQTYQMTFTIAAMWFWLGYRCEYGISSDSLAAMYYSGTGDMPRSESRAEFYWQAAIDQGYHTSYIHLAKMYLNQMEYPKAKLLIEAGLNVNDLEVTSTLSVLMNDVHADILEYVQREETVKAFETCYPLDEELTFEERFSRIEKVAIFTTTHLDILQVVKPGRPIFVSAGNSTGWMELTKGMYEMICWNYARNPKSYAHQVLKVLYNYSTLVDLADQCCCENFEMDSDFALKLVTCLINLLHEDHFIVKWEVNLDLVYALLQKIDVTSVKAKNVQKYSEALKVCIAEIGAKVLPDKMGFQLLLKVWTMYADEVQLSVVFANRYAEEGKLEQAYMVGEEAMIRFPHCINLIFNHAQICLKVNRDIIAPLWEMKQKGIEYFIEFLRLAPESHPKVPETYYRLGKAYYDFYLEIDGYGIAVALAVVKHFLNLGIAAELSQLKCFLPYKSEAKEYLRNIIDSIKSRQLTWIDISREYNPASLGYICKLIKEDSPEDEIPDVTIGKIKTNEGQEKATSEVENVLENPRRVKLIIRLREKFKQEVVKNGNQQIALCFHKALYEEPKHALATSVLFPLTIDEVNSEDFYGVWENRVMFLTVIDEALSGFGLFDIYVVAEDSKRSAIRVVLKCFQQDELVQRKFGFGSKLTILKPHTIASFVDGGKVVQVFDQSTIICENNVGEKTLCRFCLKPGATQNCSRCKWARYCNKECQSLDWKMLKHKKICMLQPPWNMDLHGKPIWIRT